MGASGDANLDGTGYVLGGNAVPPVSAGDDYEMPTDDNMRRLSAQDAAADEGDDADGYEMPTDDNMRRLSSGVSPVSTSGNAAGATATVTNNDWDHGSSATTALVDAEYYIAANTLFGIAEEGSAGAYANAPVKETSFGTAAPEHGKFAFVTVMRVGCFICQACRWPLCGTLGGWPLARAMTALHVRNLLGQSGAWDWTNEGLCWWRE